MKVLDAGCGHGRNIRWLMQQGYQVDGLDAHTEAIAQLRADFPESPDRFSVGRIEDFSSETKYDFVICNAVLHFATGHGHFDAMFDRLARHLSTGGILFIRMTSTIGMEDRIGKGTEGVFHLPDGSTRYLLTRTRVDELTRQYGLNLIEPVKTVLVDGLRSMTTLVMQAR
jgi:2-polyprenyl-3-methyl-5-hydroxy-6-metoxy-1,4-benzoquinol methylase